MVRLFKALFEAVVDLSQDIRHVLFSIKSQSRTKHRTGGVKGRRYMKDLSLLLL